MVFPPLDRYAGFFLCDMLWSMNIVRIGSHDFCNLDYLVDLNRLHVNPKKPH